MITLLIEKKIIKSVLSNWGFCIWQYVKKENYVIWVWFSNQVLSVSKIKKIIFIQVILKLECLFYQNVHILFHLILYSQSDLDSNKKSGLIEKKTCHFTTTRTLSLPAELDMAHLFIIRKISDSEGTRSCNNRRWSHVYTSIPEQVHPEILNVYKVTKRLDSIL